MKGIADAFDDDLVFHQELYDVLLPLESNSEDNHPDIEDAIRRMAHIPSKSTIRFHNQTYPTIHYRNVHILPGHANSVRSTFGRIAPTLPENLSKIYEESITVTIDEKRITKSLDEVVAAFPDLDIGSYPEGRRVTVIFSSTQPETPTKAKALLSEKFSDHIYVQPSISRDIDSRWPLRFWPEIEARQKRGDEFSTKLADGIRVIEEFFDKYTLSEISLSFNGGKDCTVLLHLYSAVLEKRASQDSRYEGFLIQNLYVMPTHPFEEVEEFIEESLDRYV